MVGLNCHALGRTPSGKCLQPAPPFAGWIGGRWLTGLPGGACRLGCGHGLGFPRCHSMLAQGEAGGGEQGEAAHDRDQVLVFGLASRADAKVAPHRGACVRVQGADEVGGQVTAPAGAGLGPFAGSHVRLRVVAGVAAYGGFPGARQAAQERARREQVRLGQRAAWGGPVTGMWPTILGVADIGEPVAAGARCWWVGGIGPGPSAGPSGEPGLCLWGVPAALGHRFLVAIGAATRGAPARGAGPVAGARGGWAGHARPVLMGPG
jgi:hypothetical protein